MKSGRIWAVLAGVVLWAVDESYVRSHPGAASVLGRDGALSWIVLAIATAALVWAVVPIAWSRLLSALGRGEPRFFAPDASDTEQAAADEELQRITKMTDEEAAERAWQDWLAGERRREEARFVKRRGWASGSRASMRSYVKAIRAEIELDRSMVDPEDPDDSMRGDIRRLEEELAWAERELERMPNP